MTEASLSDFLSFLMGMQKKDFQTERVSHFLSEHFIRQEDLFPFTHFRKDTYGRNLVMKTENFEMLLLAWMPEQRTPIHDHADQRCWMMIQSGKLCFKNYVFPERDEEEFTPQVLGCADTLYAGKHVYIDDDIAIHSIANNSKEPAVSLHLYAGPVPKCRIYNETTKKLQWVDLSYYTTAARLPGVAAKSLTPAL